MYVVYDGFVEEGPVLAMPSHLVLLVSLVDALAGVFVGLCSVGVPFGQRWFGLRSDLGGGLLSGLTYSCRFVSDHRVSNVQFRQFFVVLFSCFFPSRIELDQPYSASFWPPAP